MLTSASILAFPDVLEGFVVYCNDSRVGIGCVQIKNHRVIAYASKQVKDHEKNYPNHNSELVALVFANIWRHYLSSMYVGIFIDHKSIQHIFIPKELNLFQRRWFELLKYYNTNVLHYSGKSNVVADVLSRLSMGSVIHVVNEKKELDKEVHYLTWEFVCLI